MAANDSRSDSPLARANAIARRIWFPYLSGTGRERLGQLALVLASGFGAAALTLWFFIDLTEEVLGGDTQAIDDLVLAWVHQFRSPVLDRAAWAISFGGSEWVLVLAAGVLTVLGWQRRWGAAMSLLLVIGGARLVNVALKHLFQRVRPEALEGLSTPTGYSFPSGHAMVAAAFYVFLAYLAWRLLRGWRRWICLGGLLGLVMLIGWSRVYLGAHFLTDVLGGYLAGFLWADAVIIGGYVLAHSSFPSRQVEPSH